MGKDRLWASTNHHLDLLPGTLDMLIPPDASPHRSETWGTALPNASEQVSQDVLQVGESSLYPALQRLLLNGWVKAEWGTSDNNRRARDHTLTAVGPRKLGYRT